MLGCLFMDQGFQSPKVICVDKFPNDFIMMCAWQIVLRSVSGSKIS